MLTKFIQAIQVFFSNDAVPAALRIPALLAGPGQAMLACPFAAHPCGACQPADSAFSRLVLLDNTV